MNRTLPEVKTQGVTSGPVSSQVRGEGVVEAEDPYNLVIDETRKVSGVVKHVGDHVEIGDVIYKLEGETSDELTTAKNDLATLQSEYDLAILESGLTQSEVAAVEAGVTVSTGTILTSLEAKDNEITSVKGQIEDNDKKLDDVNKQISILGFSTNTDTDVSSEEKAVEDAQKALDSANETYNSLLSAQSAVQTKVDAQKAYEEAKADFEKVEAEFTPKKNAYETLIYNYNLAVTDYNDKKRAYETSTNADRTAEYDAMIAAEEDKNKAEEAKNKYETETYSPAKEAYEAAKSVKDSALNTYNEAVSVATVAPTKEEIDAAKANVTTKENDLKKAQENLNNKKNSSSSDNSKKTDLEKQKLDLESKKKELENKLTKLQDDRKEYLANEQTKINLEKKYQDILKKEKTIKDLEAKALGGEITSPVAGTINSLAYSAGEKIEAGSTTAVIQIDGKGYKLSFPVTNKQAKSVKVGDEVTVVNSWYYGDLTANLVAIQPDKNNTRDGKMLVFSLNGESVQPGQNLTLSVGEKSSNYDFIVPSSAIREGSNGKFILIVETKSTPFGSRYIAKQVDVKVLAEDDKNTAVDAELMGWEYVITNASKHLENGDQVKLAE